LNREKNQLEKDLSNLVETIESEQKSLNVMQAEIDQKNQELMQLQEQFNQVEAQLKEARSKKEAYDTQYKLWQNRLINAEKDAVVIKSRKSEIAERI